MRFADLFVTCALIVLFVVVAAPVLRRLGGRPELWSPQVRRILWIGALCGSGLLLAQALVVDQVADGSGPTAADRAALGWSVQHRVGWAVWLGRVLALIGGPGAMGVLAGIVVVWLWIRRARSWAVVVTATGLGGVALTNGFKDLYARSRPPPEVQVINYLTHALPSGHALGSMVVAGVVAAVFVLRPGAGRVRAVVAALAAGFVLAVGASRIYLGAHWLTDVLTGWLLGGAWLAVGITALVLLSSRAPSGTDLTVTHTGTKPGAPT